MLIEYQPCVHERLSAGAHRRVWPGLPRGYGRGLGGPQSVLGGHWDVEDRDGADGRVVTESAGLERGGAAGTGHQPSGRVRATV